MMFDVERLRSAIIFLGICVLLGSCVAGSSTNTNYVPDSTDYSYDLSEIHRQLEDLNLNIQELTNTLREQKE